MKKPDIEILETGGEGIYNGVHINQELLCLCHNDEKSDAVRSMLDALIDARNAIIEIENNVQVNMPQRKRIENVLKKVGVQL